MHEGFVAERAVSSGGSASWVVVDAVDYALHVEACAYLAGLRARDRSVNTERVYAGRVALYLTYCRAGGLDWARPGFGNLARFLRWLVDEPLPPRDGAWAGAPRYRSKKTANQIMTSVCEFLRFGVRYGWVSPETVAQLSEPKFLSFVPAGFNTGETVSSARCGPRRSASTSGVSPTGCSPANSSACWLPPPRTPGTGSSSR